MINHHLRSIRNIYLNEIHKQARGDQPKRRRLEKSVLDQLPKLLRRLRHQNARSLVQIRYRKHAFQDVLLLQAHRGAAYHNPLHRLPVLGRQAVPHKPAIAQPQQAQPPHRVGLHDPHHALGLERLGPVRPGGGRLAEEEEIGDVDVEVGGDVAEEVNELPHRVDSEAVDEEEVALGRVWGLRNPAVHGGTAVFEVCDCGPEAGSGEGGPVA